MRFQPFRDARPLLLVGLLAAATAASASAQERSPSPDDPPPTIERFYGADLPAGVHDRTPPSEVPNRSDDYDAYEDPEHPLHGIKDPGDAWDRVDAGQGMGVKRMRGDWNWGELYYDESYPTTLQVHNRCDTPEPVTITHDVPWLEIQSSAVIAPHSVALVPATIRTPPPPPPPVRSGAPDEPGWGWVEPPGFVVPPGMTNVPRFHQPNYAEAKGTVKVWHPMRGACEASRRVYEVGGHVHFRPPIEEPDDGPSTIVEADSCAVYWNLGEPPPGYDGRDCTAVFRGLATDLVGRVLAPLVEADPGPWSWLVRLEGIRTMTKEELIKFKNRVDDQLAAGSGR